MTAFSYAIWPFVVFNSGLFVVFASSLSLFTTRRAFNALHPPLVPWSTSARRLTLCPMRGGDWRDGESRQR